MDKVVAAHIHTIVPVCISVDMRVCVSDLVRDVQVEVDSTDKLGVMLHSVQQG